jgi:PAS domain S-box-containing protein
MAMGGTRKQHAYAKVKSEAAAEMRPPEASQEGFEWYRSLFEMASEGFLIGRLIMDPDGRTIDFSVLQVNRACEELTGLGREKLAGRRISEIAPSDEPGWLRHIGEVVSGAGPARFEGYSPAIGKWLEINACPLDHDDLYAVIISDVTKRKRAEEAIRTGEAFLNNIFESIQDGISVLDNDFNIVRANHIMEKWYPHMAPLKGKKCYQAYHGRSQPCDVCPSLRAIRHKDKQSDIVPFHDGSGEIKGWQELFAYPLVDEAGCVTGVIEHVRDITERRRHEESLRESEEKFRAVAETASAAICILQDGKFQYVNPAMEAISGYRKDELASIDFQAMLHSEAKEHIMAQYGRWLAGTSPEARSELKGISRDGEVRWADVSRKTISYRGRPAVLLTGTDITERK